MSSFIIAKEEYINAAGLMYGYEIAKMHPHRYFLENVYKEFVRCYELNLASVNEQYNDNEKPDTDDYKDIFEEYKEIGERMYTSILRRKMSSSLWHFFRSALYQTENKEAAQEMKAWFFSCVSKLYERDIEQTVWWGRINIEDLSY